MSCTTEWGTLLSKFVDSEVTPEERHVVESHVSGCATCTKTLELFQHNEKVLESALAGEAFGDLVVDEVMSEVRRLETPPVVAPVVDSQDIRARLWRRRWAMASAAAFLVVVLVGVLMWQLRSETREVLAQLEKSQKQNVLLGDRLDQIVYEQEEQRWRNLAGPDRTSFGMVTPGQSILVRATFADRDTIHSYEVQRSVDEGASWTSLARGLTDPLYEDRDVQPDFLYFYRFIGHMRNGSTQESAPIRLKLPTSGQLTEENALEIRFFACKTDLRSATFILSRYVQGQRRERWFDVKLGERIGGTVDGIDFSSGLVLEHIVEADEQRPITGAYPGKPGEYLPIPPITRRSKLARLRAESGQTLELWRDASRFVPIKS